MKRPECFDPSRCSAGPRRLCKGDARVAASWLALSSAGGVTARRGLGARGDVLISWRALGAWSTPGAVCPSSSGACPGRCAARVLVVLQ